MGVTIQQYRSRIGRFLPKHSNKSTTNINNKNEDQPTDKLILETFLLLILAIFTSFLLALLQFPAVNHHEQSYSHPTPLATTATSLQTSYSGHVTTNLSTIIILKSGINIFAASSFSMVTNFNSRYCYGNKRGSGIKICAWNKDKGFLQTKMPEIKNIVSSLHPHILGISEANLHSNHDKNLVHLDDYTLHTCLTISNPDFSTSRVVVYTHKSLVVKIRTDLMFD